MTGAVYRKNLNCFDFEHADRYLEIIRRLIIDASLEMYFSNYLIIVIVILLEKNRH